MGHRNSFGGVVRDDPTTESEPSRPPRHPGEQIADLLHLSPGTVKTHVGHILTKLDLRDRIQAVVFAYDAGIAAGLRGPQEP
jgi:hypothetical protein